MKSFLIIMQQSPYKNSLALEGLEFALALSSFEQPISILFKDEGVLQLLVKQDSDNIVGKDFTKIYSDLKLFGIDNVYVEVNSMHQFAADELSVHPEIVDQEQIVKLIKAHDVVLTL